MNRTWHIEINIIINRIRTNHFNNYIIYNIYINFVISKMILHTVIARGSLVIAEYSSSDDDYSSTIKRRLIEIKRIDGE